ncbi:hypothetical protein RN51_03545 [Microbacterium oxydans]|uniref:Kinase n=1 Tax=Microbacterium oxydans TaxID=82380 RepID=A0A0F0KE72_9MICO|nr:AAA family ATPase [Microbacterium oxydans]KJL18704.1 hypothetical protein RN51_03545 [Microbacterium oxydans]
MALTGSGSTRLVILRGDAASGKTTTATSLRTALGARTALISQDHFRRELLHEPDRRKLSRDASVLIITTARQALDLGYDVILDGVFNLRDYSEAFERLYRDHLGSTRIYQFDVGLEETIRRHAGRQLAKEFGEDKLREWHDGWQPLPWFDERRIGPEIGTDELVSIIVEDLRGPALPSPGPS